MNAISAILGAVHSKSGIDFSCYRPATVERRIHNRMMSLGIKDLAGYRGLLEQSDDEGQKLVERLTIKVSRFYRNPDVFDTLRFTVVPLLGRLARPIRVWSAGCGRGEEPYTLAMLLEEAALEGTITATDIDALALADAAKAVYPMEVASDLPASLQERFLQRETSRRQESLAVSEPLRSRVVFQHADLAAPSTVVPESHDLICCRNVLIYWNAEKQRHIVSTLLASLRTGGFLCLGEAEWPHASFAATLVPVGGRLRIFRKVSAGRQS